MEYELGLFGVWEEEDQDITADVFVIVDDFMFDYVVGHYSIGEVL